MKFSLNLQKNLGLGKSEVWNLGSLIVPLIVSLFYVIYVTHFVPAAAHSNLATVSVGWLLF